MAACSYCSRMMNGCCLIGDSPIVENVVHMEEHTPASAPSIVIVDGGPKAVCYDVLSLEDTVAKINETGLTFQGSILRKEATELARVLAAKLKDNPDRAMIINGYASRVSRGTGKTSQDEVLVIGLRRAWHIREQLKREGCPNLIGCKGVGWVDDGAGRCMLRLCSPDEVDQAEEEVALGHWGGTKGKLVIEFDVGGGKLQEVVFDRRPLGFTFDNRMPLLVTRISIDSVAEMHDVRPGWVVKSIAGRDVEIMSFREALGTLKKHMELLPE